jgi:hypothetical protein
MFVNKREQLPLKEGYRKVKHNDCRKVHDQKCKCLIIKKNVKIVYLRTAERLNSVYEN